MESKDQQYLTKNQQFPVDLDSSKTIHDAFIIAYSVGNGDVVVGFDNLIKTFKAKNYPFKIYHCYNPEDMKTVLVNECAKYIWIFGHGWCGGTAFKWKPISNGIFHRKSENISILRYSDLLEDDEAIFPKKLFIGQFHCNHASKKDSSRITLPEVLMDKDTDPGQYFVSDFYNYHLSIWFSTRKLVKNLERTPFDAGETSKNKN
ncbi:hypothetical protein Mpet_2785 [Methanolacinia petrolearia DSM 11571]|uniref:Uncharacterized protein n=1 Tax=Methanolacinia petrolearia (strain DSM 11571 / OCM 486 / SEBR 4847) TaxID=679926 RepID=E1RHE5_METP4|nr:hypothetical protein [Methanolacinia petrolearia]ADN37528.1 hypothetical protein Mpet_2785 [Methanolacinia petrolearia DSM 11571]